MTPQPNDRGPKVVHALRVLIDHGFLGYKGRSRRRLRACRSNRQHQCPRCRSDQLALLPPPLMYAPVFQHLLWLVQGPASSVQVKMTVSCKLQYPRCRSDQLPLRPPPTGENNENRIPTHTHTYHIHRDMGSFLN